MSYAAEAIVSAAPPPSKPAAAKSAPQAPRGDEPSFGDHLAAETEEPTAPAVASSTPAPRAEQTQDDAAAPVETAPDEPLPDQGLDTAPQLIPQPAPTPMPIANPVMVQLIASDALPVEDTAPVQAAPVAPDAAPELPQAPIAPPVQNAAPEADAPAAENAAPLPTSPAKQSNDAKAEVAPAADVKPHDKSAAPQSASAATQAVTQDAPREAPTNTAPPAEPSPTAPPPNVIVAPAAAPTRPVSAKANTEASKATDSAPIHGEAPTPAPAQSAATEPLADRVAPAAPDDDASVQEKFATALEKAAGGDAKVRIEHAPAANTQAIAADAAPALPTSAAPESMSSTTPVNALSAATAHAAAQTQALNADHVSRAAPASTQVAQEIVRRFDGGSTKFELRLDPPELGRVEVRLEVTRDHKVTAVVAADSPQALTDLARHARELEQSLQSAGLELTENGLSFDLRQSREDAQDSSGDGRSGRGGNSDDEALETTAPLARPIGLERWRGNRVDVMA